MTDAPSIAKLAFDEAKELTAQIKSATVDLWQLVVRAYDGKAWSAIGYPTWESYVTTEFQMSKQRAYQLIDYARVRALLDVDGESTAVDERQVRELKPLKTDDAKLSALATARANAEAAGEKLTAEHVQDAVAKVTGKPAKPKRNGTAAAAQVEPPPHAPEPGPGEPPFDPDDDKNGLVYCNGVRWRVDATPEERREIMRNNWEDWNDEDRGYFLDSIIQGYRPLFIAAIARAK